MEHRFFKLALGTLAITAALSGAVSAQAAVAELPQEGVKVVASAQKKEKAKVTAPAVTNLKSTLEGVQIKWKKVNGAAAYKVYKKTGDSGWIEAGVSKTTTFTDKKAKSGKTYVYRVRCLDAKGNLISGNGSGKSIKHIKAPVITKFENTATGTKITWEKCKGASAYTVYYLDGKNNWKKLGTTKSVSFIHEKLKSGKTYTYKIRCLDSKGKKTGGYDKKGARNVFVKAPEISSVKNISNGVKIEWKKLKGAAAYKVYRKTEKSGWKALGTTKNLSFADKKADSGETYTYSVRCLDAAGKFISVRSAGKSIRYIKAPFITKLENTATGIKIIWEKSKGASAYAVYYLDGKNSWKKLAETKSASFTHENLKSGKAYKYKIRCLDSKGKKVGGTEEGKSNIYIAPLNISSVSSAEAGNVISWKSVSAAYGYKVYRKTWGGSWVKLADVASAYSYTDASVEKDKLYSYTVRCLDKDGKLISAFFENTKYYFNGTLADGEIKIGDKTYSFNKGLYRSGLQTIGGKTYYYGTDGEVKKNGIVGSDKDGWYYADKKGVINLNYVNGIEHKGKKWIVINGEARKVSTRSDEVLFRAAKEVAKATDTTMTKGEKLKACFDYSKKAYDECRPRTPHYMGKDWPILYANDMFVDGAGNCFSYAAAFAYMAKAIGYEKVYSCSSGGHGWAEVDGLIYDPEWSKHNDAHTYFGLDYDRVKDPDYKGGIAAGHPWMRVEVK